MKKKILGALLILAIGIAGCGKNNTGESSVKNEETSTNAKESTGVESTENNNKTGKDNFDENAEYLDLRIGDTVCVAAAGPDEILKYKFTLNAVEYSEGEINGRDGNGDDFIVVDITVEGVGPDVSYGVVLTELCIGGSNQFAPERQEEYGLMTFANPDDMLSEGEKVTGRIAIVDAKVDLTVEKRGILTTKFAYNVSEGEIKDYVPGEQ